MFSEEFIEERRASLEEFLNKIAGHPLAQKEKCLHMFLLVSRCPWLLDLLAHPRVLLRARLWLGTWQRAIAHSHGVGIHVRPRARSWLLPHGQHVLFHTERNRKSTRPTHQAKWNCPQERNDQALVCSCLHKVTSSRDAPHARKRMPARCCSCATPSAVFSAFGHPLEVLMMWRRANLDSRHAAKDMPPWLNPHTESRPPEGHSSPRRLPSNVPLG